MVLTITRALYKIKPNPAQWVQICRKNPQTQLQLALVGNYHNSDKFSRAGFSSTDVLNFQDFFINADESCGIVNLAELDGFLAGIASGPTMVAIGDPLCGTAHRS